MRLFADLDTVWHDQLRQVTGPGIGVTVPPVLACVLSRGTRRYDLSVAIRDLREEYAGSRRSLWEHLEAMWFASSMKEQLSLRAGLEKASKGLFPAAFSERFPFLQTAWSTTVLVADMKLGSAADQLGRAVLQHDEPQAHVSAIGFTKQLAGDLRAVDGMHDLLRRILSPAEPARFSIA